MQKKTTPSSPQNEEKQKYINAIDIDYAYYVAESLSFMGSGDDCFRLVGSKAENEAANWILQEMYTIGLQDVLKEGFPVDKWEFLGGNLEVLEPYRLNLMKLWAYPSSSITNPISGELIYLNRGKKQDYEGVDARGRILLVDVDMDECWITAPTQQAELEGVLAIIFVHVANYAQLNSDALNTWGFEGSLSIPAFCISKANSDILKKLLTKHSAKVSINATNIIERGGTSYNVSGKLVGKSTNEQLIIGGHYDSFSYGFQDNASSVGLTLGIAKGLIDSGYHPNRNLIFILHGAEEAGAVNTRYDWSIGAWNQVFKIHPEWAGKSVAFINFELAAYEHQPYDEIQTTQELVSYLTEFSKSFRTTEEGFPEDIKVSFPTQTGSDDFSYTIAGIPAMVNGYKSNFSNTTFHTQFDTKDTFNETVFRHHLEMYGKLVIDLDNKYIIPLDFSVHSAHMGSTIRRDIYDLSNVELAQIISELEEFKGLAEQRYREFTELNDLVEKLLSAQCDGKQISNEVLEGIVIIAQRSNALILEAYKIAQNKLVRLTWNETSIYAHEHVQSNIILLDDAIKGLLNGNALFVLDNILWKIEEKYTSYYFDKSVVQRNVDIVFDQTSERLFWGAGRVVGHIDLYDTIESLQDKVAVEDHDFCAEIDTLKEELETQKELLEQVTIEELVALRAVRTQLSNINLSDVIKKGWDTLRE